MVKRYGCLAVVILVISCFILSSAFAQNVPEELKARLRDVREKKAQLTYDYNDALLEVNKQADERLAKIKADFRKAREECLGDKQVKTTKLRKDYENNMRPVISEEEELIRKVGPREAMNFAKTRVSHSQ